MGVSKTYFREKHYFLISEKWVSKYQRLTVRIRGIRSRNNKHFLSLVEEEVFEHNNAGRDNMKLFCIVESGDCVGDLLRSQNNTV